MQPLPLDSYLNRFSTAIRACLGLHPLVALCGILLLAGCGGLGSNQAKIFVQMGLGQLDFAERLHIEGAVRSYGSARREAQLRVVGVGAGREIDGRTELSPDPPPPRHRFLNSF